MIYIWARPFNVRQTAKDTLGPWIGHGYLGPNLAFWGQTTHFLVFRSAQGQNVKRARPTYDMSGRANIYMQTATNHNTKQKTYNTMQYKITRLHNGSQRSHVQSRTMACNAIKSNSIQYKSGPTQHNTIPNCTATWCTMTNTTIIWFTKHTRHHTNLVLHYTTHWTTNTNTLQHNANMCNPI